MAVPAGRWSRLLPGLAALYSEVTRAQAGGIGRWHSLLWQPVPAIAGVGGMVFPDGPATRKRRQFPPPVCLAVMSEGEAVPLPGHSGTAPAGSPQPDITPAPDTAGTRAGAGRGDPVSDTTTLDLKINPRPIAPRADIADLVRRVKNGENEAFGAIYDRYVDLVFRYVFYRVGSTQLTEDIVSETFLRAWRRIGSFRWQGPDIGAWFVTIARNLVIDYSRAGHTRFEFPTDDILSAAGKHAGTTSGAEEMVLTVFRNRALLDAVRALSPDQQECVVLRFLEGLSLHETALAMNRKENAIKALQLRAVRALARHLPPRHDFI
jgi:RNA polymerase sigma-70 factor (ECF subfamily)